MTDINLALFKHPLSGDIPLISHSTAIKQAVRNICLYGEYENPYDQSAKYLGIYKYLFNSNSEHITKSLLTSKVKSLIDKYEPRVTFEELIVSILNENIINISIRYLIKATNESDTISLKVNKANINHL